ncbi:MAG TPA: hypothetical protein P5076_19730, partial [Myxococcota bacterium]|nr:hypothetical protein [Myxococcota bacterium]
VNGKDVTAGDEVYRFFEGTSGKSVVIKVGPNPTADGARDVTVVLTGRANRDLLDIAVFEPRTLEGRDLYCIVLDDPHPREVQAWSEQARCHLGALLPARQLRRAWDALWQQCFLHELGHVRYARRHGWGGREAPSEEAAEAYAWSALHRLHPRATCLLAWGLSYLADAL